MRNRLYYLFTAFSLLLFSNCTKTEKTPYETEPLNRILEYKVTNVQQELYGAIDNEKNTITVYIPYYLKIDYIIAAIELEENALLVDSSGNEIYTGDGLEPVPVGETRTYRVKSNTGEQRSYTLLQEILPHSDSLVVDVSGFSGDQPFIEKPVYGRLTLLGNFESTSLNAKFYLTNKTTGQVHTDFVNVASVTPGKTYTMLVDISPDAKAGEYSVKMEHQGRTVNLPDLKLYYQRPWVPMLLSSSIYAAGDTIVLAVSRQVPNMDEYATVFVGLTNLYMKIGANETKDNLPAGFPDSLIDKKIAMEIISYNGKEVKAVFPNIPSGIYIGAYTTYGNTELGGRYYLPPVYGICFYGDFDEQTDWGKDVFIASQIYSAGGFTVSQK